MKIFTLKTGNIVNASIFFILGLGLASTSTILNHNPYGPEYAFFNSLWPGLVGLMMMSYYIIDLHAQYHAWLMEVKKKKPNHLEAWIFRAILGIGFCFLIHAYYHNFQKLTWLLLFTPFWFLLVFNPRLNKYRELPFFYIAKKDDGSWLDGIFNNSKWGGEILYGISIVAALFCAYMYIK